MSDQKTAAGGGPGLEGFLRLIAQAIARNIIEGRDGASFLQEPGKGAPNTLGQVPVQGKGKEGARLGTVGHRTRPGRGRARSSEVANAIERLAG